MADSNGLLIRVNQKSLKARCSGDHRKPGGLVILSPEPGAPPRGRLERQPRPDLTLDLPAFRPQRPCAQGTAWPARRFPHSSCS